MALTESQMVLHDQMVASKERAEGDILAIENVRAVAVGLVGENNGRDEDLAIIVYVRDPAAAVADIPAAIDGFPVIVEQGDFAKQHDEAIAPADALAADTKRYNPLTGGISIAPSRVGDIVGTLGLMVQDGNDTAANMMLSNYHVMCLSDGKAKRGDEMCQEARADNAIGWCGNCAELSRWFAGNTTVEGKDYGVDGAVAKQTARGTSLSEVVRVGKLKGIAEPAVDMAVEKHGRTTEYTTGVIRSISATVKEDFGAPIGEVDMKNQILVRGDKGAFSAGGDSGSVIVATDSKMVVALLWGGSSTQTAGNHIKAVVTALDIVIAAAR